MRKIFKDIFEALGIIWVFSKPLTIAVCIVCGVLAIPILAIIAMIYILILILRVVIKAIGFIDYAINDVTEDHPRISRYLHMILGAGLAVLVMTTFFNKTAIDCSNLKAYRKTTTKAYKHCDELKGVDISAWQADTYSLYTKGSENFCIARVANGQNVDPYCDLIYQNAKNNGKLLGAYFYCDHDTWDTFDPVKHAKWCAQTVEGYLGWTVFFLDIENQDNVVNTEWAEAWLKAWHEETGVTACLYMNQDTAETNNWSNDVIKNTPLWVANYNGEPTLSKDWKVIAHQFTDTPVDSDVFFGTAEDWWKLCEVKS